MDATHWVVEGRVDPRWPLNTRGNIGEVMPEVVTPLQFDLVLRPAEQGFRDAFTRIGLLRPADIGSDEITLLNVFGGYAYLNLSLLRLLGVRAPRSSAEVIDATYVGEGAPPQYEPHPGDRNVLATLKLVRSVATALRRRTLPDAVAVASGLAAHHEANRPALGAPDDVLIRYLMEGRTPFRQVFAEHIYVSGMAAIPAGILTDSCIAAGDPAAIAGLIGRVGDVRSAEYSLALAAIATDVDRTPAWTELFDEGVNGLLERARSNEHCTGFVTAFDDFTATHGHRGPNDWDIAGRTWANTPSLALAALDRMRGITAREHDASAARRSATEALVRARLKRADRATFDWAIASIPTWTRARELTRDRAVRLLQPIKQVVRELANRYADRGGTHELTGFAMLHLDELKGALAEPGDYRERIAQHRALHARFAAVPARFLITGPDDVPTIETLEATAPQAVGVAVVGDVLAGAVGSPGIATGRVRIVLDPADCADLAPGEILVCPITDPAWTPLFIPAAAVVVNVGALLSHAIVVSRELGIPCVAAVPNATHRLIDGMLVTVDGNQGTVTILDR